MKKVKGALPGQRHGFFKAGKWLFFISLIFILSSCIGVNTTVTFNNNGSGKLSIKYRISKMVVNIGNAGEGKTVLPLPVTKEDFTRSIEDVKGLKLLSVKQNEDANDIFITAEIEFDKIEDFAKVKGFKEMPATLTKKGNSITFNEKIAGKPDPEPDKDSLKLIDTLFKGYNVSFNINAPKEIKSHNIGKLSADKKSVTYIIPVGDLLKIKNDTYLTVTW